MNLNIDALETSFDHVAARGDEIVDVFYERLFAAAPACARSSRAPTSSGRRACCWPHSSSSGRSLRDLDAVTPKLRDLGARHVRYGARPEHYPVVGQVLIASMAEIAGDAWTVEYELAWTEAFAVVSGAMLDGADRLECVS